jgi:DNA-binding SARP family transcriptional activator
MKMENIVIQTLGEISTVLVDSGVEMDSWRSDAVHKILLLAFNRVFQEGRSAGLKEVMGLFAPGS